MAITVKPKDLTDGFEAAGGGNMPWQLIERGGARGLIIKGADDLDFEVFSVDGNWQGLIFSETDLYKADHREIWLSGQRQGLYSFNFVSRSSGATVYYINVDVVNELEVVAAFYYLPGVRKKFNVEQIVKKVNAIWNRSANVTIKSLGMFDEGLGQKLDIHEPEISLDNKKHLGALIDYGNHASANWHVYLGWGVEGDIPGETLGTRTIIDTLRRKETELDFVSHTIAHELGHRICRSPPSHDTQAGDLMLEKTKDGRNNKIRRPRVKLVNRPTP
ncbi:hypothetical protein DWF00_17255 [Bosea caraganae]|uniref:Uncharacterized protein n=1 Tax=Bosea caraganae TaxID=2763117 RepID=A0A370L7A7_9HYPH|nr:hypothetical protein [Bosea caraganae]RDJ24958.1 hypothetical protein DWF00_17255 [Bosea caraganae]RDJ26069.1 hypothetical protein DWE98_09475 [Bosea caraganae]